MSKCEWKDEGYEPCDNLKKQGLLWDHNGIDSIKGIYIDIFFCPFCGADIRKKDEVYIFINREKYTIDFNGDIKEFASNIEKIITEKNNFSYEIKISKPEAE